MADAGQSALTYEEARKTLGEALTELKRQVGSPSIDRVIARGKNKMSGPSQMSKGAISDVLNGKRAPQSLDRLLWLVRALLAFEDGTEVEPPDLTDPRIQKWRSLWGIVEDARALPSPKAALGRSPSDGSQGGVPQRRPPDGTLASRPTLDTASVSSGQAPTSVQALPSQPADSLAVRVAASAVQQGLEVRLPALQTGEKVWALAFSPDGRLLASGRGDGMVQLWDPVGRRRLDEPPAGTGARVSSIAFSPDGRLLASGSVDGSVRVWDSPKEGLKSWEWHQPSPKQSEEPLTSIDAGACSVAFSPDGKSLAVGCGDGMVQLWDPRGRHPMHDNKFSIRTEACSVAFSPNGELLAVSYEDHIVELRKAIRHGNYEAYGDRLTSRRTGSARQQHGLLKRTFRRAEHPRAGSVAFSPDGSLLATTSRDGIVRLWDPAGRQEIQGPVGVSPVVAMAFLPNSSLLAIASSEGIVRLWDPATHKNMHEFRSPSGEAVLALAFSPDGSVLATGGVDSLRLWAVPPQRGILRLTAVKPSI